MKIIAINGSSRKKWNTATLLEKALEGAATQGAETELIHLYDRDFKGCSSCFACKLKGGKSYGKCAMKDDLTRIFGQAESLWSCKTLHFEDCNKVVFNNFDPEVRRERRRTVFPKDCRKAFELGARWVGIRAAGAL